MSHERTSPILQHLQLLLDTADTAFAPDAAGYPEDADFLGPATKEMHRISTAIYAAEAYCDKLELKLERLRGKRESAKVSVTQSELLTQEELLSLLRRMLSVVVRHTFSTATAAADRRTLFFVDLRGNVRMARPLNDGQKSGLVTTRVFPSRRKTRSGAWIH
jgi:hypothetical protein